MRGTSSTSHSYPTTSPALDCPYFWKLNSNGVNKTSVKEKKLSSFSDAKDLNCKLNQAKKNKTVYLLSLKE